MHRIEGANNLGGHFTDGPPPTTLPAAWCESVQEEICNVIESLGNATVQSNATDTKNQLASAILNILSPYDYIVTSQETFNSLIERTGANSYKIIDSYKSIYFKNNDYLVSGILSGGDTWGSIVTNYATNIIFESGASIHFANLPGGIEINTANCYLQNVCIKGTGSVASSISYSFKLNAAYITFDNCITSNRLSNTTFYGFLGSATAIHQATSRYINCLVRDLQSSSVMNAFESCRNLGNCIAYNITGTGDTQINGFANSTNLSNCTAENITSTTAGAGATLAGFNSCYNLSSCYAYTLTGSKGTASGFNTCFRLSCCCVNIITTTNSCYSYGFYSCLILSGCDARNITVQAASVSPSYGYYTCDMLSSCYAYNIWRTAAGNTAGFINCNIISACKALNINAGVGSGYGFTGCLAISSCFSYTITGGVTSQGFFQCQYGASLYSDCATNGSNDWIDSTDAQITNKWSCQSIWT